MPGAHLRLVWIAGGVVLLALSAATTNFWDDECNGFFLAQQAPGEILRLLAVGWHEDPPLFDLLAHHWQKLAGYDPLALRALSLACWLVALEGMRRLGESLGGPEAGWLTVAAAVALPYHWLIPAAFRWYALFAALAVWNSLWLLRATGDGGWRRYGWLYVASGAALWYVNSAAPAVFAGQLALLLTTLPKARRPELGRWLICQACIVILFLPWLPTFIGQLHRRESEGLGSILRANAHAWYGLWLGEISLPYDWWISLPAALAALAALLLLRRQWAHRALRGVLLTCVVILLLLVPVTGVKRMIIVSPFVAVLLGLLLAETRSLGHPARRWFLVSASLALAGCLANYARRADWLGYRWLLPMRETVGTLRALPGSPLLLTNSNGAAFHAQSSPGIYLVSRFPERLAEMSVLPMQRGLEGDILPRIQARAASARTIVYLHEAAFEPYRIAADGLERRLRAWGFRVVRREFLFPASERYLRHHPRYGVDPPLEDRARLVVVYFERVR